MATKLLLIEDVEDLGRSGDIVNVKPGFWRNFLSPNKLAVIADKNALRRQDRLKEERQKKAIEDKKDAEVTAEKLAGLSVSIIVKVDHDGHMYGSVSALDIANLIQEQKGIQLEKRSIQLKHPIKETGDHTITLKLKEGITATINLKISSEEIPGSAPTAAPKS